MAHEPTWNELYADAVAIVGDDEPDDMTREELISDVMLGLWQAQTGQTYPIEQLWDDNRPTPPLPAQPDSEDA